MGAVMDFFDYIFIGITFIILLVNIENLTKKIDEQNKIILELKQEIKNR